MGKSYFPPAGILKSTALIAIVICIIATVVAATQIERFCAGKQVLENPRFDENLHGWTFHGKEAVSFLSGGLELKVDALSDAGVSQYVQSNSPGFYRLRYRLYIEPLKFTRMKEGAGAVVNFDYHRRSGKIVAGTPSVRAGPLDGEYTEALVFVSKLTKGFDLGFWLKGAVGSIRVDNVSLVRMKLCNEFKVARVGLAVGWLVGIIPAVYLFWGVLSTLQFAALSTFTWTVVFFSVVPGAFFHRLTTIVGLSSAAEVMSIKHFLPFGNLMDWAHFAVFFVCGVLSQFFFKKIGQMFTVLFFVLGAISIEVIQMLSLHRSASWADLLMDMSGWLAGFTVIRACNRFSSMQ